MSGLVTDSLVAENPLLAGKWVELLRPVRKPLLPSLAGVFRDPDRPESERSLATDILADYAADQPDLVADLIKEADVNQYAVLMPILKEHGKQAVACLEAELYSIYTTEKKCAPYGP